MAKQPEIQYVVENNIGMRQIAQVDKLVDSKPYKLGDTIEQVAYKQGMQNYRSLLIKQIIGGQIT